MQLRQYQIEAVGSCIAALDQGHNPVLQLATGTGKSLIIAALCQHYRSLNKKVWMLTHVQQLVKQNAEAYNKYTGQVAGIVCAGLNRKDLDRRVTFGTIQSMTNILSEIDEPSLIIIDEAHSLGAFPKKNKRCKDLSALVTIYKSKVILLSGTPTPESYSQMYHQVCFIPGNPFDSFKNFYQFCRVYVKVRQRKINSLFINDYSDGSEEILDKMKPFTLSYTQKEAGFEVDTSEEILYVNIDKQVSHLIKKLTKDRVIEGKEEVVLADTPVKLMTKVHQMCSGTIKFESGRSQVLDKTKAEYIKEKFKGKKIAIFYKFKAELKALKEVFEENLCETLEEFNTTPQNIALQIVSGREGISLSQAEALIYYNIDFSATSYWQSRDRMTTKTRLYNKIYWVFAKGGIEDDIYKTVVKKKDYTLNHFKRDLLTL